MAGSGILNIQYIEDSTRAWTDRWQRPLLL